MEILVRSDCLNQVEAKYSVDIKHQTCCFARDHLGGKINGESNIKLLFHKFIARKF